MVDFGAILEIALAIVVAAIILVGIYFLVKIVVKVIKRGATKINENKADIK
jgi:hypothetical protein